MNRVLLTTVCLAALTGVGRTTAPPPSGELLATTSIGLAGGRIVVEYRTLYYGQQTMNSIRAGHEDVEICNQVMWQKIRGKLTTDLDLVVDGEVHLAAGEHPFSLVLLDAESYGVQFGEPGGRRRLPLEVSEAPWVFSNLSCVLSADGATGASLAFFYGELAAMVVLRPRADAAPVAVDDRIAAARRSAVERLKFLQDGEDRYQFDVAYVLEKRVERLSAAGEYDPSCVRALVRRMRGFVDAYRGHPREAEVRELLAKFRPLVPEGPPTLADVWADVELERTRFQYGPAYALMTRWLEAHPDAPAVEREPMEAQCERVLRDAREWWEQTEGLARKDVEAGRLDGARARCLMAVRRLKGIPAMFATAESWLNGVERMAREQSEKR